jgi:putative endonuclease
MKFVYILESVTHPDRHYTGLTDNIDMRLEKHNAGQVRHTSKYAPWRLKTYVGFTDPVRAQESVLRLALSFHSSGYELPN